MKILDSAILYLRQGRSVIPMSPKDKRPLVGWTEFQKRQPTEKEVCDMFKQHPNAMCGLITGQISNIAVLDCDSEEASEKVDLMLPESFVIPIAQTPRGGRHYYFSCDDNSIQTKTAVFKHCDIRANGGCIVCPPSINSQGKAYQWLDGLELTKERMQPMPSRLKQLLSNAIANNNINNNKYIRGTGKNIPVTEKLFESGRRDNDLFSLALSLRKQGWFPDHVLQVLINVANTWGEQNEIKWLQQKVESAFKHEERKIEDISKALDEWILLQDGYFSVTSSYDELRAVTVQQKTAIRGAILRRVKSGILEKHTEKSGIYRKVDTSEELINFLNVQDVSLNLKLPFQIENYVKIMPKNIIVIAGEPNSGKTAFLLNCAYLNMQKHDVFYFSSEMGGLEMRDRLSKFDIPLGQWRFKAIERGSNFADVVRPDAINIIDFLELTKDFYMVSGYIKGIFDKLRNGISIIALQKNPGCDHGLGGFRSLEKPRLYLAMEPGKIKIVKGKNWANSELNPNGLECDFKLVSGCKFIQISGWKKP